VPKHTKRRNPCGSDTRKRRGVTLHLIDNSRARPRPRPEVTKDDATIPH